MKNLYYLIILFVSLSSSCNDLDGKKESVVEIKKCPCDSSAAFTKSEKYYTQCHIGQSMIEIAHLLNNDTIEVTRRYPLNNKWYLQEFMVIANNKLIVPDFALYCDIKDTADFYKLTYISNEDLFINQGVITNSIQGVEVILDKDTIRSKSISVLAPKNKFKGIVEISKKTNITYKGKVQNRRSSLNLEAESMIKYGNLLEQYKAINRLCNKNNIANTLH